MPAPKTATPAAPTPARAPAHAAPHAEEVPVEEAPVDEVLAEEAPVVDDAAAADVIATEATEFPPRRSSLHTVLELALTEPDVDPSARYTDVESKVARALIDVERVAYPDVPHYDGLRILQKRRMLAEAKQFLTSDTFAAALVRALLS